MADKDKDETPPTTEVADAAAEHATDAADSAHEEAHHPDPPKPDDIPEWGKGLMTRVEALETVAAAPVEEGVETVTPGHGEEIDDNPVKPPWHQRPMGSIFGFGK